VNNAGVGDLGVFVESDVERQTSMLQLNMVSLTALTRLFLPLMVDRESGRILHAASLAAYFSGEAGWSSYVGLKSYVLTFTRGLAAELRETGVTAMVVSPGTSSTGFVGDAQASGAPGCIAGCRSYRSRRRRKWRCVPP
jgi:short-subunit dehydrogenase